MRSVWIVGYDRVDVSDLFQVLIISSILFRVIYFYAVRTR
jgi:hypothetical protein